MKKTIKKIISMRNGGFFILLYSDGTEGAVRTMKEVLFIEKELENKISLYQHEFQKKLYRAHKTANILYKEADHKNNSRTQRLLDKRG